jgi:hypothetical protein
LHRILPESYLWKVSEAYVTRHEKVWTQKSELVAWLEQTIGKVLQEHRDSKTANKHEQLLMFDSLAIPMQQRYGQISLDYFQEELPQTLPDAIQPIDGDLLDPRILGGGVRFPGLNRQLQQVKQRMVHNKRLRGQQGWFGQGTGAGRNFSNMQRTFQYVVDLTLPLLQLFFLTFMPWVKVPRYNRV